ncbi:MAG: hypothetical protein JKP98_18925 [Rhodobacteraceae bacterium]|nr:hypothetical protein [Paracoccaceae bacterium]
MKVEQADTGVLDLPNWDQDELEQMRNAINVVGSTVTDTSKMFGRKEDLDPVYWMMLGPRSAGAGYRQKRQHT